MESRGSDFHPNLCVSDASDGRFWVILGRPSTNLVPMPADLRGDTAVTKIADGRYRASLPESWDFFLPSGGVLMTTAMRAMREEVDAELQPFSATTIFARPVSAGELVIDVDVLRRGNVAVQLRATVTSEGERALEVSATFVRDREGPELLDRCPPPDAAALDDAPPYYEDRVRPRARFFQQLESRLALGARFWGGDAWEQTSARYGRWFRYRVDQRVDGALDPLALPPIVDTMPAALIMGVGPEHPSIYMPSLDLTVHFLAPTASEWLLAYSTCRRATRGYATCDMEIWDPEGRLVAFGTQTMIVRRVPTSGR